jgi:tripartite-type tricarboxylate transporter receptor subunit TctC
VSCHFNLNKNENIMNLNFKFTLKVINLLLLILVSDTFAQNYPLRSVRIVVPFSPGGGTDYIARLIAAKLTALHSQSYIVENRAGAGSSLGTEYVLKSLNDGYILLLTSGSYTVAPNLYKLRYDPLTDMTPIIQPDDGPFILVAHPSLPVYSVREFVDLAKGNPKKINYASSGVGSISHMSTELFSMIANIQMTHIPYKGTGQSVVDTVSGHNQILFASSASVVNLIKNNRVRAIAVTSANRVSTLPNIPTFIQSGYDFKVSNWHGLIGPKGMTNFTVERLNTDINKIISEPDFTQKISTEGLVAAGGLPEKLQKLLIEEISNWIKVSLKVGLLSD